MVKIGSILWIIQGIISIETTELLEDEIIINSNPSKRLEQSNTVDKLKESGTYFRNMGKLQFKRGYYQILTPINFEEFEKALERMKNDSEGFYKGFTEKILDKDWAPCNFSKLCLEIVENSKVKQEMRELIMNTISHTDGEIARVEEKFKALAFAFRERAIEKTRPTRALMSWAGKVFRFLFGTATIEDVKKMNGEYKRGKQGLTEVLHANKEMMTAMKLQHSQLAEVTKQQIILKNATETLLYQMEYQIRKTEGITITTLFYDIPDLMNQVSVSSTNKS